MSGSDATLKCKTCSASAHFKNSAEAGESGLTCRCRVKANYQGRYNEADGVKMKLSYPAGLDSDSPHASDPRGPFISYIQERCNDPVGIDGAWGCRRCLQCGANTL